MVCKNCGANIPDTSKFCTTCGATVDAVAAQEPVFGEPVAAAKDNSKLKKLIIPVAAGVVALIVVLILIFGGSYKTPIKKYFDAIESGSGSKLMASEPFAEKMLKAEGESSADIKEEYKEKAEELHEDYADKYGDDFKIKYKIKDADKMDKDDLEEAEDYINLMIEMSDVDMKEVNISGGYEVEVDVEVKGSEDEDEFERNFTIIKINGKWNLM